jgi:ferredoxin
VRERVLKESLGTPNHTTEKEGQKIQIVSSSVDCVMCGMMYTSFVFIWSQPPSGPLEDKTDAACTLGCPGDARQGHTREEVPGLDIRD